MSTPASRKGWRKLGLVTALAAAFGLFLTLSGTASASVTCLFNSALAQATVIVSDDNVAANNTVTFTRGINDSILVNNAPCIDPAAAIAATTLNTRQVNVLPSAVTGADGNDTVNIDERQGRFVPGAPGAITTGDLNAGNFNAAVADGNGLNEVEWWIELGDGFGSDNVEYWDVNTEGAVTVGDYAPGSTFWDGTLPWIPAGAVSAQAAFAAGDTFMNINAFPADDDADVYIPFLGSNLNLISIHMGEGDNYVSGKGGDGTGQATFVPLVITGGGGADSFQGGLGPDYFLPGAGANYVDGNLPVESDIADIQDDIQAAWLLGFFYGDFVDFSNLAGPLTLTLDAAGNLSGASGTYLGIEGVAGTEGNDTITGNEFENLLVGAGGNDTISGAGANDFVDGDNVSGFAANSGTDGDDTLAGDAGNDTVVGGPGNDTLNENTGVSPATQTNGSDALDGGPGIDTIDYGERTSRVVVYLGLISTFNDGADTNADGLTNEFDDVFFTTENAITGSGQDIISANFVNNRSDNVFTDNGGNDCLEGGPGNDTFNQSSSPQGADVMIGDTGADTANYADRSAAVAVSLDGVANDGDIATNEGDNVGGFSVSCRPATIIVNPPVGLLQEIFTVQVDGEVIVFEQDSILNQFAFTDTPIPGPAPNCFLAFVNLEFVFEGCDPGEQLGGDQAPLVNVDVENVNGGSGDDVLTGNGVGNVLNGNAGNDTINGGAATDQLNGGAGDDTIAGGPGNDAIDGGEGTNRADYSSAGSGGVGVQVNLTTGTATGDGNDTLKSIQNVNGSSFADSISGDGSNNVLNGFGGNDAINGNAGDDTINGGAGADQLKGASGADKITGSEGNDAIQGGSQDDWLQGGQGKDTILGQKGNDKLYGNAQPDFLNGGQGQDVCKPGSPGLARGDVVVNCER